MPTPVEDIKQKLDIVEFLRGYLTLQPAGKNFKALCPFHREKTPSFMVSPERQTWHCFGCNLGGDIFSFVIRYENIDFGEALRILADKAGIELRRVSPAEYKFTGLLHELNQAASEFFRRELANSAEAKKYLHDRGLKSETVNEFEVGWAPNQPEALTLKLLNAGHRPEDLVQAGLSIKTERGLLLDRFRGRIMFPIHNHFGKVVGFTGRVLPTRPEPAEGPGNPSTGSGLAAAKYVNSPETPIFSKSKLLYGFWKSKNDVREKGSVFLVEGQTDFLMSWQAGIKNVVASSGTALTADHLRVLRRLTDKLVLSFDNDQAGWQAGERAIDLAEANDFEVKVISLGKYKDPAEAAQDDPVALAKTVSDARPAMEFYFERYLPKEKPKKHDREFLRQLRVVLGKIKIILSPVEQNSWFKELAKRVGISEKVLEEESARLAVKETAPPTGVGPEAAPQPFSRREILSQRLISAMLGNNQFDLLGGHESYLAVEYREVVAVLRTGARAVADPQKDEILNLIVLQAEAMPPSEVEEMKNHLFYEYLKDRRRELSEAVKRAEAAGDDAAVEAALREFNQLPAV